MNRRLVALLIGIISLGLFVVAIILMAPQTSFEKAIVTTDEYNAIRSNRQQNEKLELKSLKFNDEKAYYASEDGTWYYSIVEGQSNTHNPDVRYDSNIPVNIAFSDEITDNLVESGELIKLIIYNDSSFREYELAVTTLPIIAISHDEELKERGVDAEMSFELFDNRLGSVKRVTKTGGKIHIRGASSSLQPKKSYRLNLRYKSPGEHDRNANESLLGMREDDDWILNAPYRDDEKLRISFNNDLWRETSEDNQNIGFATGVQTKWVEVIENGKYTGLYVLHTTVDEKSLEIQKNNKGKYDSYIVFKQQWSYKPIQINDEPLDKAYELRTDENKIGQGAYRKIRTYLYNTFTKRDIGYIKNNTDLHSLIDTALFIQLTEDSDKTKGDGRDYKNIYLVNLPTKSGEKYVYIPWDMDATWGDGYKVNERVGDNNFTSGILGADNEFNNLMVSRYKELRNTHWSEDNIMKLITEQETNIFKSGAYTREANTWPKSALIKNKSNWNLDQFRKYVKKRLEYVDYFMGIRTTEPEPDL